MGEQIINWIMEYGLDTVILAFAINMFTGLIKIPIKAKAKKSESGSQITRYLVFLPLIIGLLLSMAMYWIVNDKFEFNRKLTLLWLNGTSLSLAFYSFWEKLFPSKERIMKDIEIEENAKLIDSIKAMALKEEKKEIKKHYAVIQESGLVREKQGLPKKMILSRGQINEVKIEEESA